MDGKVKLSKSTLLTAMLLGQNLTQKNCDEPGQRDKAATQGDLKVSSNSAFRKPVVREDQSVAAKSNCVDDSNPRSVANSIGASQRMIGNPNERSLAAPSPMTAAKGRSKVLSFMEKA